MDDARDDGRSDGEPWVEAPPLDAARIAAIYVEYGAELKRFIVGVVRDPELAADVLQATFTKAIERGHTVRAATLKGWLFRVALNEALAARRRRVVGEEALRRRGAIWSKSGDRPEESLIRGETVERVRAILETLPEDQRTVVRMRIYEEKTFAEIAQQIGTPLGTVLTRMRLALEKLRRGLPDNAGET